MEQQEQILDYQPNIVDEQHVQINLASAGKRFGNYIIDIIAFWILIILLGVIYGVFLVATDSDDVTADGSADVLLYIIVYGIYFLYFYGMEAAFQKTLGKMITKTKVVTMDGQKPTNTNILGRTACRFIPFDAFSFLGSKAIGWHDSISKTYVINDIPSNLSGEDHKVVDQGF